MLEFLVGAFIECVVGSKMYRGHLLKSQWHYIIVQIQTNQTFIHMQKANLKTGTIP